MNWHHRELMRLQREYNLRRSKEMDMEDTYYKFDEKIKALTFQLNNLKSAWETYTGKEKKENMTFGEALEAMENGKRVKRGCYARCVYFAIQNPGPDSKMTRSYIYISDLNGDYIPHCFEHDDMLAKDWYVVQ